MKEKKVRRKAFKAKYHIDELKARGWSYEDISDYIQRVQRAEIKAAKPRDLPDALPKSLLEVEEEKLGLFRKLKQQLKGVLS